MLKKSLKTAALCAILAFGTQAFAGTPVTIGTGGETGVYYPVGGAICRLAQKQNLDCKAQPSGGSVENAKALEKAEVNFALVQSDIQMQALTGTKEFRDTGPLVRLRSVFSLHAEPLHLMVAKNSTIRRLDDLKTKTFSIGNVGSGSHAMADIIFREKGWAFSDFPGLRELTSQEQMPALCAGEIEAAFWVAGLPNAAMQGAAAKCGVRLISLQGGWVDDILTDHPQYVRLTIPAKIYGTNAENVRTFGPKATLLTNADLPENLVYQLTKAVFEKLEVFKEMHPALALLEQEEMIDDAIIPPLHPGAKKYYKERGWVRF